MIKLNNILVDITKFPNGESLIKSNLRLKNKSSFTDGINIISCKYESDADLIHLMMIKKHLDSLNADVELFLPYVPYSRMDRTEGNNIFTLKYVCDFINSLNFQSVGILEPHSDVSIALLNKVNVINATEYLTNKAMKILDFKENSNDYILFPDAGAEKRYLKQIKFKNTLTASKERDFETGYIKKLEINGNIPTEPFRVIIVDDLCSKGGTFILSGNKLKELGATEIYLIVAHCENTIYDGEILKTDLISRVYTTDSILSKFDSNKIEVNYVV